MASVIRGNDNFDSATGGSTTYGAVGTYAWLHRTLNTEVITQNSTYQGSGLHPAGVHHIALSSGSGSQYGAGVQQAALSGTWRAMGQNRVQGPNGNYRPATLFVRIS